MRPATVTVQDLDVTARLLADLDVETPLRVLSDLADIPDQTPPRRRQAPRDAGVSDLRFRASEAISSSGEPLSFRTLLFMIPDVKAAKLRGALRSGFVETSSGDWWVPSKPIPPGDWGLLKLPSNVGPRVAAEASLVGYVARGGSARRR